jgi:nuclear pore complex protein Nup93
MQPVYVVHRFQLFMRLFRRLFPSTLMCVLFNVVREIFSCSPLQRTHQVVQLFHILAKITGEPPGIPSLAHAGAHILNTPPLERRHARAHLGDPTSREAVELRKQIAAGAREALEEQYLDVVERTVQARPLEACLGGDPSIANRVRAFLLVRYYRGGGWQDRIEVS